MSKIETVKGVLKTLFWLAKEELDSMDHKLVRIAFSLLGFLATALFWYLIFNRSSPV